MVKSQLSRRQKKTLSTKLRAAEFALGNILEGKKVALGKLEKNWLLSQLTAIYDGHYSSSPASAYLIYDHETPEIVDLKGDTRFHAIGSNFVLNQKRKLVDDLHSANIHNFYVMGSDDLPPTDADHYVLVPSGIEALHQAVSQMQRNMQDMQVLRKLVIIQNNDQVWKDLISHLRLNDPDVCAALGCQVTKTRNETKNAILFSGKDSQKTVSPSSRTSRYKNGMEAFLGSTQPKKTDDTQRIIEHEKFYAGLKEAVIPLHWFLSADEISRTFEGNTFEKIEIILDRIYEQIGYDEICKRQIAKGFDPHRTAFFGNDTGFNFSEDLSDEIEFAVSRHEMTPGKPWPGVELGTIVDAHGGIVQFMADVKACRKRLGRTTPLRYRDTQLYMFFKLEPKREDVRIESYFGTGTGYVTLDPRPSDKGSLYTENFCIPDGQPEGAKGKTQAELGDTYLFTDSPQARCIRAIMMDHQIPPSTKSIFKRAAKINHRSLLPLMTPDNWLDGVGYGSGGPGFDRVVRDNGWKLSAKTFSAFEEFAKAGSAIYLGPHSKKILADYDHHAAQLSLLFCKAGTHKQILHDVMYGKALMICNPELQFFKETGATGQNWADPALGEKFIAHLKSLDPAQDPWARQLLLYYYYHANSLIKQKPEYIWQNANVKDLPAMLRKVRDAREPHGVIDYDKEEFGSDREDMFSVTVLGSASTRNPHYTQPAQDIIGYQCAHEGIHVRTGGGRYGIMGAVARGYMKYQDTHPGRASHTHLSAIQMPRTVQFEGLAMDIKSVQQSENRYIAIEPDMDSRMMNLFRSNVSIVDAGGLGTLEEIFKFVVLKQQNHPLMEDKPLIVTNHAHLGSEAMRLYDPLLAVLSEHDRKDVIVVSNAHEAFDLTLQIKRDGYKSQTPKIVDSRGLPLSPS